MKTSIVILNYNMPERTDALVEYIAQWVQFCNQLIVFDNGSDQVEPSQYTTHSIEENVQTTRGWLNAFHCMKDDTELVWMIITSCEFHKGIHEDPLRPMQNFMAANPNAVGIHPALTVDSTTSWNHLKTLGFNQPRETWMIDNIAPVWRWDWLQEHMFDPELEYAWGIDLEACWQAREEGRSLWVHEQSLIRKETDIGYKMDRMGMTAEERRTLAGRNMAEVLSGRYGPNWWSKMTEENVPDWML